jgi:hypothetical protein
MLCQIFNADFLFFMIRLPDIAHHASAIATTVRHHNDDGEIVDAVRGQ